MHNETICLFDKAGPDSVIGEKLNLGEKSAVKRSMIGNCCEIGDRVKINNSIIMDNVKIREGYVKRVYIKLYNHC